MKIAVCEDNIETLGQLESILYECCVDDSNRFEIDTFLSGEELVNQLNKTKVQYQIYILDIEMKKMSGLEVASFIRASDAKGIIIFETSHNELMQEAFDVNAFHYLMKPLNSQKVKQVILRAAEAQNVQKKIFHYKIRKKISTLYLEQIEYFESFRRKIYINSTEGVSVYYGSLKDVNSQVDDSLFVQVHNSFIVNMGNIKFVDACNIELVSGLKIPITKKYNVLFNKKYRNFVMKKME